MIPILVLCFARADTLKQTITSILKQPHGPIYISCDGPTKTYELGCAEVREYVVELLRMGIIQHLRISETNEGTLLGVSNGIDWFFKQETIGIIIEDDLVLEPRLLEAVEKSTFYLFEGNVMSIGLYNRVPRMSISDTTTMARRSKFVNSWGWLTTREEWNNRVTSFQHVNYWQLFKVMTRAIGPSSAAYHFWFYSIQRRQEREDARKCNWDDLWQINCFLQNKTVAAFNRNLITNIGDGEGATHTFGKSLFAEIVPITDAEFKSSDCWNLPHDLDKISDAYFMRDRRITTILRETVRIRTRLGLRKSSP